jgi:hypothetical protein
MRSADRCERSRITLPIKLLHFQVSGTPIGNMGQGIPTGFHQARRVFKVQRLV